MTTECRMQNAECRITPSGLQRSAFCILHSAFIVLIFLIAAAAHAADRPDLIVVVSIDQFRYEYLARFEPYFAPDGFRRFIDHGADFTHAYYTHALTVTGPGHASIGTGYTPSVTGIVGNDWYERDTGKTIYCVADPRAAGGFSPVNLQSDSLGDRVQEKYPGARVYGVAIKDRAAVLMAGRKATAAYWFESKKGGFTSSSYYRSNAALTAAYNTTLPQYLADHPIWAQSSYIPAADLPKVTYDPESLRKYKSERLGLGLSFPHPIQTLDALTYTPFGNGLVIGFAEQLITTEHLGGTTSTPDVLFVGLSSPDYLGHCFGPDSLEVADSAVRTDRDIAGFLAWLDEHLKDRYTIAITADHGVQSIPEVARALGRDAGRQTFSRNTAGRTELERLTAAALGIDAPANFILSFEEPSLYLNWARVAELKLDGERVKRAMRDAALKMAGVGGAFTNTELMMANPNASPLELAVRRSFRADRSGDVLVTLKNGWVWGGTTGATHGQPVEDDQHVPVMLWGRGVRPHRYDERVAPTDLAKSLGSLLGVDAGAADSRILPSTPAGDLQAAIRVAIAKAPHFEHLIPGEKLPADARGVMAFDPMPADTLPAGYARLDRAEITGDTAVVTLWYGPIPKPEPGQMLLSCGSGYTYQLQRDSNGEWQVKSFGIAVC